MEKDEKIADIVNNYKNGTWSLELAQRELAMLGLELNEARVALGMVQLNG